MIRIMAYFFGLLLVVTGVLGVLYLSEPKHALQEYLCFNLTHNLVHIATGIIALTAGSLSLHASRIFFRVIGIVYLVVAVLGFFAGAEPILGIITDHIPEIIIHGAFALFALYLGFWVSLEKST